MREGPQHAVPGSHAPHLSLQQQRDTDCTDRMTKKLPMDAPTTSTSGANAICCHPEFSELFKMKLASDLGTFIPSLTFSTMGNADSEAATFQPCTKPRLEET